MYFVTVVGLTRVRKANIRMEFNVYVNSQSDASVEHRRVCDARWAVIFCGLSVRPSVHITRKPDGQTPPNFLHIAYDHG